MRQDIRKLFLAFLGMFPLFAIAFGAVFGYQLLANYQSRVIIFDGLTVIVIALKWGAIAALAGGVGERG